MVQRKITKSNSIFPRQSIQSPKIITTTFLYIFRRVHAYIENYAIYYVVVKYRLVILVTRTTFLFTVPQLLLTNGWHIIWRLLFPNINMTYTDFILLSNYIVIIRAVMKFIFQYTAHKSELCIIHYDKKIYMYFI